MKITLRSISFGINLDNKEKLLLETKIGELFDRSIDEFNKNKIDVRTNRLMVPPLNMHDKEAEQDILKTVEWLSNYCLHNNIRWFCVPFSTLQSDLKGANDIALTMIKRYRNLFINYIVAKEGKISRHGAIASAKLIKSVSKLSNSGYDNFRVGTSFNCPPNAPFFPFTYQNGDDGFAIAVELVPILVSIIKNGKMGNIDLIREESIDTIVPMLRNLNDICLSIEKQTKIKYYGADISLAPYPSNDENSVAYLIENLGVDGFGSAGMIFFTAFLTNLLQYIVKKSKILSIGFNGVMYSLLEDTRLGITNNSKEYSIDSLISYSAVCGCGIDMVPIPGDTFEEEIASLILDVASLSSILNKPLGIRILPIPMKSENEFTEFNHEFLHNTRIKGIKNRACTYHIFDSNAPFVFKNI